MALDWAGNNSTEGLCPSDYIEIPSLSVGNLAKGEDANADY